MYILIRTSARTSQLEVTSFPVLRVAEKHSFAETTTRHRITCDSCAHHYLFP